MAKKGRSMQQKNPESGLGFSRKQSDLIAQLLNVLFNNATFYGGVHPSTKKSAIELGKILDDAFSESSLITLVKTGDSLYIEKNCVDQRMNVARFINTFVKTGIESISFEKGTSKENLGIFIAIFSNLEKYPSVESMNQALEKSGVEKIKFNYVFYKKVTTDETIIAKEALDNLSNSSESYKQNSSDNSEKKLMHENDQPNYSVVNTQYQKSNKQMLNQISKIFSFRELVGNPDSIANSILTPAGNVSGTFDILSSLKEINKQISIKIDTEKDQPIDEILDSVFRLTSELRDGVEAQKEMGKIIMEEGLVIDEVDKMTYQAIIQLVREEYRKGEIPIKRLAHLISRILPDIMDLKKLLPQLKDALLEEGLSLADYLKLTKELHNELATDGILNVLQDGASDIGLTADDIVQAITSNPKESARLLVLASEIRQSVDGEAGNISDLLSDYIETISKKMALSSREATGGNGGDILEKIIHQIESQLVNKLKTQGIDNGVVKDVEDQLVKRFPKTLDKLKADWMVNVITEGEDLSSTNLVRLMNTVVHQQSDFISLKDPVEESLKAQGFDKKQIEDVFDTIANNIEKRKQTTSLPGTILSRNNTKFFLLRQIKECLRYNNPFTCIVISVTQVKENGKWVSADNELTTHVLPELCTVLKGFLRDIDLVGTFGQLEDNNIFIILPMTKKTGANIVKKRIQKKITQIDFKVGLKQVELNIIFSITPFEKDKIPDYKSYKAMVVSQHLMEEDLNKKQ